MTPSAPTSSDAVHRDEERLEVVKEASTMALYVAICVMAALIAASHGHLEQDANALPLIWGTALGLALAHWFAFRVSSRLIAGGSILPSDARLAAAQMAGAAAVAVVATVPALLFEGSAGPSATRWVLTGVIAGVAYLVGHASGAGLARSLVYASTTTVMAMVIVIIKNAAAGH